MGEVHIIPPKRAMVSENLTVWYPLHLSLNTPSISLKNASCSSLPTHVCLSENFNTARAAPMPSPDPKHSCYTLHVIDIDKRHWLLIHVIIFNTRHCYQYTSLLSKYVIAINTRHCYQSINTHRCLSINSVFSCRIDRSTQSLCVDYI